MGMVRIVLLMLVRTRRKIDHFSLVCLNAGSTKRSIASATPSWCIVPTDFSACAFTELGACPIAIGNPTALNMPMSFGPSPMAMILLISS